MKILDTVIVKGGYIHNIKMRRVGINYMVETVDMTTSPSIILNPYLLSYKAVKRLMRGADVIYNIQGGNL
jgi:hypothetical protein